MKAMRRVWFQTICLAFYLIPPCPQNPVLVDILAEDIVNRIFEHRVFPAVTYEDFVSVIHNRNVYGAKIRKRF